MNPYDWCEKHIWTFFDKIGADATYSRGIIGAHGDKVPSRYHWEQRGIPFEHALAIFLASYLRPYSQEICWSRTNFDPSLPEVEDWIVLKYPEWKQHLPPVSGVEA